MLEKIDENEVGFVLTKVFLSSWLEADINLAFNVSFKKGVCKISDA